MTVRVRYFALLREERGLRQETLEAECATVGELYEMLRTEHGFRLPITYVRFAVGGVFAPEDYQLKPNDEVAFIPPVAGG